jgi:hypothetical protein
MESPANDGDLRCFLGKNISRFGEELRNNENKFIG